MDMTADMSRSERRHDMDLEQEQALKEVASLRQRRADIKSYVQSYLKDSPDTENARAIAKESFRGLRPLLRKCNTMGEFKSLIENRYSAVLAQLEKYGREKPSVQRLEKIAKVVKDAIDISIQNDDCSAMFSPCLVKAFALLSERPKESKGSDDIRFSDSEQESAARAVEGMFNAIAAFHENYNTHRVGIINLFEPPDFVMKLGDRMKSREALKAVLFRKSGTYNPECFELLMEQSRIQKPIHAIPDFVLRILKPTDLFDEEFIVACSILLFPLQRKYLEKDPQKYNYEAEIALRQIVFKMHACDVLRDYDVACVRKRSNEDELSRMSDSVDPDERIAVIDKLHKADSRLQDICVTLSEVRLTIDDLRNFVDYARGDKVAVSDNGNGKTGNRREHGRSSFPDGEVTSLFYIADGGYVIRAKGESFKITRKKTWAVIDKLLRAAKSQSGDGWVDCSGKELNLFRTAAARRFRTTWIEEGTSTGSKKIYRARLKTSRGK